MTERASASLVTILFTDLVGSTELLSRAGDDEAQRIFRAHHNLLAEVAAAHGGEEVKWLGDGLMVAFPSAVDALHAATAMQQQSRRPVSGEHLAIRVGLNAGEALRDATDYFGTAVVVARRLCDRADAGQILCSETVAGLVAGRAAFSFISLGKLELKGVPEPVAACELGYELGDPQDLAIDVPLVGRDAELARLTARLADAAVGRGRLVIVTGEAGIGKTALLEEFAAQARSGGSQVLGGRCFESDWSPPYAPFAQALADLVAGIDRVELANDLGSVGPALAALVPALRSLLPDLADPAPVPPDEERFRLLDGVAQFILTRSHRAPVVLLLDDLQWADQASVAMLRHLARTGRTGAVLVVGAYRDAEVDRNHPLADALSALRREVEYDDIALHGLGAPGVVGLLAGAAGHAIADDVAAQWLVQTDGNPFFIKELLRHLVEEGHLTRDDDGRWHLDRPLTELGLPRAVREVVARRLGRLSDDAHKLLSAASAFDGPFQLDAAAAVADLDEDRALDALDEALAAQALSATARPDVYDFAHGIVREVLHGELSPARQLRVHRKVAEALLAAYGEQRSAAQAGEIAVQYHRSRSRPGADAGVEPALEAAAGAQGSGAHEEAARFLRMALDLLPDGDERHPLLLGRLGIVLAWALRFDEAVETAGAAGDALAETEGKTAAAEYLADAAYVCAMAGSPPHAWALARTGLTYASVRDVAWARMTSLDAERRAAEDPDHPGIPADTQERRESARILRAARLDPLGPGPAEAAADTREEVRDSSNLMIGMYWVGQYAATLTSFEAEAAEALRLGRLARAARALAGATACQAALGRLADAAQSINEARAISSRLGIPVFAVVLGQECLTLAFDDGWDELAEVVGPLVDTPIPALAWGLGFMQGVGALTAAARGDTEEALRCIRLLLPWLEKAPPWTACFPVTACNAAETLWRLRRTDHADVVETALRDKVLAPGFRSAMRSAHLSLARLCALRGRYDEARFWFSEARPVLVEEGSLPLLAITDHDEALMYLRRGSPGDGDTARPLLARARRQFEVLGMAGWLHKSDDLAVRLGA